MPAVDVVIPCYRYGAMLPDAVRSVLDQHGVEIRVLIIDDSSDDGSAEVAQALAERDNRIDVRVHESNRGHIVTFNEGVLEWASAEYTLLLSADDMLAPGALSRATALLDAHPGVGFVYGNAPLWDGSLPLPVGATGGPHWIIYPGAPWLRRRFTSSANCVFTPSVVTRTSVQKQVGGYNPELLHTSDFEMWMRFALHGDVGFVAGIDQAYARTHGANMSDAYNFRDSGVADLEMRLLAFSALLRRSNGRLPDAAALERQMRRKLARSALLRVGRAYDKGRLQPEHSAQLVEFARDTVGDVSTLPEWHTLRLRQRLGVRWTPMFRLFVLTAAGRRVRRLWRERRFVRRGI